MEDVGCAAKATPGTPCCCGRVDCSILRRNSKVIESLENDVKQAATMGQALLVRHEAYMADAERERTQMAAGIEKLEQDKLTLEIQNAKTISENRELLNQLEELNEALIESDIQVKSLTATLESTQLEMKRLTILAARTESLERQLAELERDQAQLHETFANTDEDRVSAVQRWQKAERIIASLQDQVDRIELEAKEERERHIEVVGRMERRRAVEKELETAAGRLKGAAAMKTSGADKSGSNVVSHFVKDILQDNANLQMGIVELRDMLMNSNEEVERLREQVILHQPLQDESQVSTPNLESELKLDQTPEQRSPELHLHVHHHVQRRVKKASRKSVTPAHFQSPASQSSSASHTPRASISRLHPTSSPSAATILQHTAVTIPQANQRWSIQSNQTGTSIASSVPSSPYAHSRRPSSLFDRGWSEGAYDSSRPTSPESSGFVSPKLTPMKGYIPNEAIDDSDLEASKPPGSVTPTPARRNFTAPLPLRTISAPMTALTPPVVSHLSSSADPSFGFSAAQATIPEEAELEDSSSITPSTSNVSVTSPDESSTTDEAEFFNPSQAYPRLRRSTSHDSLLSISGMDIHAYPHSHKLIHRPSHHLLSASPSITSSGAVVSSHMAQASISSKRPRGKDSRALLSGMSRQPSTSSSTSPAQLRSKASSSTLTQKVGGWISGKWGVTPSTSPTAPSGGATPALAALFERNPGPASPTSSGTSSEVSSLHPSVSIDSASSASKAAVAGKAKSSAVMFRMRTPGVNQAGPIWGFGPEPETPFKLTVENVDTKALEEAMEG